MAEFDAYLMVDWSASSQPVTGGDSVWYCLLRRKEGGLFVDALANPSTRYQAASQLKENLRRLAQSGQRVLVGFDFPFGYPTGFARALHLNDTPLWSGIWRVLTDKIVDRNDNSNNRFTVAADLNFIISSGAYPFWGCPLSAECSNLCRKKSRSGELSERRMTDVGNMQPIWKLYGNGSVGSQAFLGIPVVAALRHDPLLALVSKVWPFETGLCAADGWCSPKPLITFAEIYPSLLSAHPAVGEVKDAAQVRTLAAHFATLDNDSRLSPMFAGPDSLTASQREHIEHEEGWTLGVSYSKQQRPVNNVASTRFEEPAQASPLPALYTRV